MMTKSAFLALLCVGLNAWAIPTPPDSSAPVRRSMPVRIRLSDDAKTVAIRGFDLKIHDRIPGAQPKDPSAWRQVASPERLSQWSFQCVGGKVLGQKIDVEKKPQDIELVKRGKLKEQDRVTLKSPAMIRSPAGFLSFQGRPYREEIRIYSHGSACQVINTVDIEKYLDGLVNSEFSAQWNEEAIAAQVVAARTYAIYQMKQARSRHGSVIGSTYDLDASVRDQVYDGSFREDYRASRAVEKTRGMILFAKNGKKLEPIKAFYHSTCGGETELPHQVWGKPFPGFTQRVKCPFCVGSPRLNWSTDLTTTEITRSLLEGAERQGVPRGWPKNWVSVLKRGRLVGLTPLQEVGGKRNAELRMIWRPTDAGGTQVQIPIAASLFRSWISALRIRSTAFRIEPVGVGPLGPRAFRLIGSGNGHGVGLCQWGAKGMAERGYSMAKILAHYYPATETRQLW